MPLPAGAILSARGSKSELLSLKILNDIVLPCIGPKESVVISDEIKIFVSIDEEIMPTELCFSETIDCFLNVTVNCISVLHYMHQAKDTVFYPSSHWHKIWSYFNHGLRKEEMNSNHMSSLIVTTPISIKNYESLAPSIVPGSLSIISFELVNYSCFASRELLLHYSQTEFTAIVSVTGNDKSLELIQESGKVSVKIDSIPENSSLFLKISIQLSESVPLFSTLPSCLTLTYNNFFILYKDIPINVGSAAVSNPDILVVITAQTPNNEINIWCRLLSAIGFSYLLWDTEMKEGFSVDSLGNRHSDSWTNCVDDEGMSTFKICLVLYTGYKFIKSVKQEDIIWLHQSGCGFVFLRGNTTGQLLLHKCLSEWQSKVTSITSTERKEAGKVRNALQRKGDVTHRHFLTFVSNNANILERLPSESHSALRTVVSVFSRVSRTLIVKKCLLPSHARFLTVGQFNQIGVVQTVRKLVSIEELVRNLRENPEEKLYFDDNDIYIHVTVNYRNITESNIDHQSKRTIANFALQVGDRLSFDDFKTFTFDQGSKSIVNLGHPCETFNLAIASLFGIGVSSIILALPMESKLDLVNQYESCTKMNLVLPGGTALSLLNFCLLAIAHDLYQEVLAVRNQDLFENFEIFESYCNEFVASPSEFHPKMDIFLYFILFQLEQLLSFKKNVSSSKGSFKLFLRQFMDGKKFKRLSHLFNSNVADKATELIDQLNGLSINNVIGLDKLSKFPLSARHRFIGPKAAEESELYYTGLDDGLTKFFRM
ncbi:hypothetical protein GEMRC1_011891 [Eukaryota sp. GEM-RC1]